MQGTRKWRSSARSAQRNAARAVCTWRRFETELPHPPSLNTHTLPTRARTHTHTRTDHAKHLFAADLRGLDASVRALERVFKEIREHAAREAAAVPKARALLQAARTQQQALAQIAANLPAHLPGAPGGIAAAAGGGSFSSKAAGAAADGGAAAPGLRRGEWSRRLCECKCCHQCRCWALAALVTCLDVCVALLSTAPLLPKLVHTHTHTRGSGLSSSGRRRASSGGAAARHGGGRRSSRRGSSGRVHRLGRRVRVRRRRAALVRDAGRARVARVVHARPPDARPRQRGARRGGAARGAARALDGRGARAPAQPRAGRRAQARGRHLPHARGAHGRGWWGWEVGGW